VEPHRPRAGLNGTINGWNPTVPAAGSTTAQLGATGAPPAAYTGLALMSNAGGQFLLGANVAKGTVDVFNSSFAQVSLAGSFTDPGLPAGNAPFNVSNIGGRIFVTYEGPSGIVNEFDTNGNFVQRFATGGPLFNPWGMALAPASFGEFGGALLIGNFNAGDPALGPGHINAFNPANGAFLGALEDPLGNPLAIDGLWELRFGNGGNGGVASQLYFAAGIDHERHGLVGTILATPEPGPIAVLACGLIPAAIFYRRRKR
jgi:uncharacterized protein (TIGR03118 family)